MAFERENQVKTTNETDNAIENEVVHWYALYTRPRFEKKVAAELDHKGLEAYLPLQTVVRQWSDRRKKVEEPLFRSYVFVHVSPQNRIRALQVNGVVRMVGFGGKPSIIPDEQIEAVRRFLEEGWSLEPVDYLTPGDRVEIIDGPFAGTQGILEEKRGKRRFVIRIDAIRQAVAVEIQPGLLRKLDRAEQDEEDDEYEDE